MRINQEFYKIRFIFFATISLNFMSEDRKQRSDNGIQPTDAGSHIGWIVHSCNPLDLPALSSVLCLTLCATPFAPCSFWPQSEVFFSDFRIPTSEFFSVRHALCFMTLFARNSHPVSRNPKRVTRYTASLMVKICEKI